MQYDELTLANLNGGAIPEQFVQRWTASAVDTLARWPPSLQQTSRMRYVLAAWKALPPLMSTEPDAESGASC